MAQELWAGLIGTVLGSVATIIASWMTSLSKARLDDRARWQERQFQIEDQEREDQKVVQKVIDDEDRYCLTKALNSQ